MRDIYSSSTNSLSESSDASVGADSSSTIGDSSGDDSASSHETLGDRPALIKTPIRSISDILKLPKRLREDIAARILGKPPSSKVTPAFHSALHRRYVGVNLHVCVCASVCVYDLRVV